MTAPEPVVVLSHPGDLHATTVIEHIEANGFETILVDLSELPTQSSISIDYADPAAPTVDLRGADGVERTLSSARSVWWRRPQAPTLDAITDPDIYGFSHGEWHEGLNGMYQLLRSPWMNDPIRNEVASHKALQLAVASKLGLRTPRTLMTSDPDRAREFIEREGIGNVIYKTFAATHQVWRETRLVREADLDMLDTLRYTPVIFQEYISAVADHRVTVVGSDVFPMSIDTRGTDYEVDFRVNMSAATCGRAELPDQVEKQLRRLMERFGLVYGAIDLRETDDGDFVFLEVNPAGEFLFAEHHTGFPITSAMSNWLRMPY